MRPHLTSPIDSVPSSAGLSSPAILGEQDTQLQSFLGHTQPVRKAWISKVHKAVLDSWAQLINAVPDPRVHSHLLPFKDGHP